MHSQGASYKFCLLLLRSLIFNVWDDYLLHPVEALHGVVWRRNDDNFVEIFGNKSFAEMERDRFLQSRLNETHNFNGATFKLAAFPIKNLIEFISNDTMVTGIHGDTWRLLSSMFNFKLHCIRSVETVYGTRSENGSWNGLLGYMYRNEADVVPRCVIFSNRLTVLDFTVGAWITSYRFCMKEQLQQNRTWMTELFNKTVWFSVMGLFFALSLASFTIHLFNFRKENSPNSIRDLRDHFFYVFSIFCNQGWTPPRFEKRSKIWLLSTRFFSWLLIIAFSSKLIAHVTQQHFQSPFDDLESFYENTDYTLLVKRNSLMYSAFTDSVRPIKKKIINAGRFLQVDPEDVYQKVCTGKYVYLETQDVVEAEDSKLCEIRFVGKPYFDTWIAGGVVRGFEYRRTIDAGMLKLHEFGITGRLKSKWLTKPTRTPYSNEFESISLEHVSLIFSILCIAVLLSLLILLIENIIHLKIAKKQSSSLNSLTV